VGKARYGIITPVLERTPIDMHPIIYEQFELSQKFQYQFKLSELSAESIQQFQLQTPLHAIKEKNKPMKFFSGWHLLPYCYYFKLETIVVVIHKNINEYAISNLAWSYLLSTQISSYNQSTNLAYTKEILSKIPSSLKATLLSSGCPSSEQKMVEKLTGEVRSTIRNQIRKIDSKVCSLPNNAYPIKNYIK
jgi:hypothetical protein